MKYPKIAHTQDKMRKLLKKYANRTITQMIASRANEVMKNRSLLNLAYLHVDYH